MILRKFFFMPLLLAINVFADLDEVSMNNCLKENYEVFISHRTFPLGLTTKDLSIKKEKCLIEFTHTSFFVWKKGWTIDVCREPVHIKKGARSVEVIKRRGWCDKYPNGSFKEEHEKFCSVTSELEEIIENDGLIFADGEKENILNDHGKVYCSFVLLKRYLRRGEVFSRFSKISSYKSDREIRTKQAETDSADYNRPSIEVANVSYPGSGISKQEENSIDTPKSNEKSIETPIDKNEIEKSQVEEKLPTVILNQPVSREREKERDIMKETGEASKDQNPFDKLLGLIKSLL